MHSLAPTGLAMALETEFNCTILDSDADVMSTVGRMITYMEGRVTA